MPTGMTGGVGEVGARVGDIRHHLMEETREQL